MAGTSKDSTMAGPSMGAMPPATIRNKKRAAMSSVVAMSGSQQQPPIRKSFVVNTFIWILDEL